MAEALLFLDARGRAETLLQLCDHQTVHRSGNPVRVGLVVIDGTMAPDPRHRSG